MSEKYLKIFGIAFLSLLVIYLITKPRNRSVDIDKLVQSVIIGVQLEDVSAVEIYKRLDGDKTVSLNLKKHEDQWRIPTHFMCKGEKSSIERLITDMLEMTGKVRSSDVSHFSRYQIGDDQGVHMLLKDDGDNTLANIIVGKKPEDAGSGFVRIAGRDKVYFTDRDLLSSVGITGLLDTLSVINPRKFIDLDAVVLDTASLQMVGVVKDGKELVVKKVSVEPVKQQADSAAAEKQNFQWVLMRNKKEVPLEHKAVKSFLPDVTKIFAGEVIDRIGQTLSDYNKNAQYGFQRPRSYIVYIDNNNNRKAVVFGKPYDDNAGYYMLVKYDGGLVYKVSKSTYNKIFKWMEDLPGRRK